MKIFLILLSLFVTSCKVVEANKNSENSSVNDSNNTDNSDNSNQGNDSHDQGTGNSGDDIFDNSNTVSCSEPGNNFGAVGSGFLQKPFSDSDGNLVLLFANEYTAPFISVKAVTLGGELEEGEFVYFSNPDRQTWRFSMPGTSYTGRYLIENPYQGGVEDCEIQTPSGGIRYE